ncbi:hypothetical protein SRHO_G00192840 [Serrasalmus rhombeus]
MKALHSQWRSLVEREGLLYRCWESPVPGVVVLQLLVPRALLGTILQPVHGQDGVGHFGTPKTLRQLRQGFYWPGCSSNVELFVCCCTVCTAKKGPAEHSHAPLQMLHSSVPMERVGVDVLGPFPETERGNSWGSPRLGQHHCIHSDGLVERLNRTLATQLAMVVESDQSEWDLQLPLVLWACHTTAQETSGFTPALLMLGCELRTPVELVFSVQPREQRDCISAPEYVRDLLQRMEAAHQLARENQKGASE